MIMVKAPLTDNYGWNVAKKRANVVVVVDV